MMKKANHSGTLERVEFRKNPKLIELIYWKMIGVVGPEAETPLVSQSCQKLQPEKLEPISKNLLKYLFVKINIVRSIDEM